MEHPSALSRLLHRGWFLIGSLLPPDDLSDNFQPGDLRKKAGCSLRMSAKHPILVRREILATIGPFEDLVGQRDTAHQAQRGGKFVLPWLLNPHSLCDPQHDIPNGAGSQGQPWRRELDQLPKSSNRANEGSFQQVVLRLLRTPQ